jgi:hypothetical protein
VESNPHGWDRDFPVVGIEYSHPHIHPLKIGQEPPSYSNALVRLQFAQRLLPLFATPECSHLRQLR